MIVVETSALMAILLQEEEAADFEAFVVAHEPLLPACCWLEAAMTWRRKGMRAPAFDAYVTRLGLRILPFDERQGRIAIEADRRFGRATGHPAQLNFGDCMSYAAAIALDAPLLFKGEDFVHTDVKRRPT